MTYSNSKCPFVAADLMAPILSLGDPMVTLGFLTGSETLVYVPDKTSPMRGKSRMLTSTDVGGMLFNWIWAAILEDAKAGSVVSNSMLKAAVAAAVAAFAVLISTFALVWTLALGSLEGV